MVNVECRADAVHEGVHLGEILNELNPILLPIKELVLLNYHYGQEMSLQWRYNHLLLWTIAAAGGDDDGQ